MRNLTNPHSLPFEIQIIHLFQYFFLQSYLQYKGGKKKKIKFQIKKN